MLISKYGLDILNFHNEWDPKLIVTWETCNARKWLNNVFLYSAFNKEERKAIPITEVDNSDSLGLTKKQTVEINNTQDQVFLLSYHEVFDLYLPDETARQCAPTDTAIECGARASAMCYFEGRGTWAWWLRSPGDSQYCAAVVKYDGSIGYYSGACRNKYGNIRRV